MEVAGIAIGGIGLVALFDNCMNAFHCIDSGIKYGRDYQEAALKVSLLQLRLVRWRHTVEIVEDRSGASRPKNIPVASDHEVEIVRDLLESIQNRFKEIERASKRHGLDSPIPKATQPAVPSVEVLTTRMETLALTRQKTSSFSQKAKWALHDKRKLTGLIQSLDEFISDLVNLFPGTQDQQMLLAKNDAAAIVKPSEIEEEDDNLVASSILNKASQEVDPELKRALEAIAQGKGRHSFGNTVIRDSAMVQQGDYVGEGYRGRQLYGTHSFGTLDVSGTSRVQQGDNYGGKSVFDD